MSESEVVDGIYLCIEQSLKWDTAEINDTSDLKYDYGADTFELFLLARSIKQFFGLSLSEEQLQKKCTVEELKKAVIKEKIALRDVL